MCTQRYSVMLLTLLAVDVHGPWDDPIGPVAIVFSTALALTLNFIVGIISGKFSDSY
jgi:ABC-type polysaccharide/polyol phosphate export permease